MIFLYLTQAPGLSPEQSKLLFNMLDVNLHPPKGANGDVGVSYREDGLYVGDTLLPKSMYSIGTITSSRIKFKLFPSKGSVLLPIRFHGGAADNKKRAIENVLDIMDDRSPETTMKAFGVGGDEILVSLSNPAVTSEGLQQAKFTMRLHSRMANIYLAEAMAKMGDTSLLAAYLNSYIDMLAVNLRSFGRGHKISSGVLNSLDSIDMFFNNAQAYDGRYVSARAGGYDKASCVSFWLLRLDQIYHGVLDTIAKYRDSLSSLQEGCLDALIDKVSEAENISPIKEDREHVLKLLKIIPRNNFPFTGDSPYTRALNLIEGYNKKANSYSESQVYSFDGWMFTDPRHALKVGSRIDDVDVVQHGKGAASEEKVDEWLYAAYV